MRLSSPSVAAAFIEGARAQGADVVDYGMMGTDMLYFAVARDGHDGGAQITASHNPEAIQRHQDGAAGGVSAERRRRHRRHPRHDRRRQPAAAGGDAGHAVADATSSTTTSSTCCRSSIRRSSSRSTSCSTPAAASAGMVAPLLFEHLPCRTTGLCFEVDGTFPNHEANPLIEENRRDIVERVIAEKADIGIAWDGDADRVLLHRRRRRVHRRRLRHGAARRGVPDQASRREDRLRRPRQLRGQGHGRASTAARRS